MSEDDVKTIVRIGLSNSNQIEIKFFIGNRIGEEPFIVDDDFDVVIKEIKPGIYGLSLLKKFEKP